jgi:hypothetical protein
MIWALQECSGEDKTLNPVLAVRRKGRAEMGRKTPSLVQRNEPGMKAGR